ncbi:MAG: matrixin family metalloprotease [Candidatus Binataceae bacterium]
MPAREFENPIHDAVTQWNAVFTQAFAIPAFVWTPNETSADVIILFNDNDRSSGEMGETEVDADQRGIIRLPVKITLEPPTRRGGTGAAQVMFDVAAHELGHALGLPHINKPGSIMCCDSDAVNFDDPAARAAYIAARRHPDLRSVLPDIEAHYRRFWAEQTTSTPPGRSR